MNRIWILIVILADYHHTFHSSLEVLSISDSKWDTKTWVHLPVQFVSFRHSKFYFPRSKSSQFASHKSQATKEPSKDVASTNTKSTDYFQDHHHIENQQRANTHGLSPGKNPSMHHIPKPLSNAKVTFDPGTDFLRPPIPAPLDTRQDGERNQTQTQDWQHVLERESMRITTSSIVSIKDNSNLQHHNTGNSSQKILTWLSPGTQNMNSSMNFYEPLHSSQDQYRAEQDTLQEPLLELPNPVPKLTKLSSSTPNSSSVSKQIHLTTKMVNKFILMDHNALARQSREKESTHPRKRSSVSSKQHPVTNNTYLSTEGPFMNYSTGDLSVEAVDRIDESSDAVLPTSSFAFSTDNSNYSILSSETIDSERGVQNWLSTPMNRETTDVHPEIKSTEKSWDEISIPTASSPTKGDDERAELIKNFNSKHPVKVWAAVGFYDDSYPETINSHWLRFEPADPLVHKMLGILYGILMVVGCCGNLLVIVMFVRCRSLRTPPNYLIVNLAVSDFLMMVKMPVFIYNSLYEGPALGVIGCKIYGFIGGLTGTASIMTLATISLDRYYVIVYPMNPLKRTTSARAILMMSAVWLYSALFSSIPLFGINDYVSEGYLTSCSFDYLSDRITDRVFVGIFFVAAFVSPLSIIVFSYSRIFQMVRAAERVEFFSSGNGVGGPPTRESFKYKHDHKKHKTEIKIAVLSSAIILIWLLAWTPYAIIALLGIFGYKEVITPFISSVPALFCKTASCIDPFIYAINHPRFQRELKNKFKICYNHQKRRASAENSYYSNTFKENSENSVGDVKKKQSPPTVRGSTDSVRTPKTSEIVTFKETESPRFVKSSRNSPVPDRNPQNNFRTGGLGCDDTNILSQKKIVQIPLVSTARLGHISSPIKKQKDPEPISCEDDRKNRSDEDMQEMNSLPKSDKSGSGFKDSAPQDTRDLRMKSVLLSNKKSKKLSTSCNNIGGGGGGANNVIVNTTTFFNGKSLNADSTSRNTSKLETTIM